MRSEIKAFTLIELILVAAVVGILIACWLPAFAYTRPKAERLNCSNNLRQVGVAFLTWSAAHNGTTPMVEVSVGGGDSGNVGHRVLDASQITSRGVSKMFLTLSNELSTPKKLFCPAEYEVLYRHPATTFAGTVASESGDFPYTNDLNCSYFIGIDARELFPRMLLTGDHNLGGNTNPPTSALLSAPSTGAPYWSLGTNFLLNMGPAWLDNMHRKQGNVGLADGSVEWLDRSGLQTALTNTGDPKDHSAGIFALVTGVLAGYGCNRIQLP